MTKSRALIAILLLPLFLLACQDAGPLLPQLDSLGSKQRVKSIAQGSQVKPGQTIPVELAAPTDGSTRPDTVTIGLYNASDADNAKAIATFTPSKQEISTNRFSPLTLPVLPSGSYKLVFRMSGNGNPLHEESVVFFYSPDTWDIGNVFTYPGTLLPGGEGLLDLVATVPTGARAWVRWSMGSEVLKSGLIDNGRDRLQFQAKGQDGVYSISVEIFPQAPDTPSGYSFRSPYARDVQVVVSSGNREAVRAQDADYLHRFHFGGSLQDTGRLALASSEQALSLSVVGQRKLDIANEILGYRVGSASGFKGSKSAVPDVSAAFQPFAVYLRLLPLVAGKTQLFVSQNAAGTAGLRLDCLETGQVEALAWGSDWEARVRSDFRLSPGSPAELTLGLARVAGKVHLVLDTGTGEQVAVAVPASLAVSSGSSKVSVELGGGAAESAPFILDEFGVFQPAERQADWDAFYLVMMRRYGAALHFAQDFLTDVLPSGLKTEGDVRTSQGALLVPAGASVSLPPVMLDNPTLHLELRFSSVSGDKNTSLMIESATMAAISIGFDGVVRQEDRVAVIPAMRFDPLSCTLVTTNSSLSLQGSDFEFQARDFQPGSPVTIRLVRNGKASSPLALLSIVGREARQAALSLEP